MKERSVRQHPHVPVATYRLQFNPQFTFPQATALVPYLAELGISDVYASPLTRARAGSMHGYDVVDPARLNPELAPGGNAREAFGAFTAQLQAHQMGLLLDVVPNHMCIAGAENEWWNDVLENGPSSPYASYFDIDWQPPKQNLRNKVLLPTLGDQYGRVLENQELHLAYQRGAFFVKFYETKLPIAPRSSMLLLQAVRDRLSQQMTESHPQRLELESILTALAHLPPRTDTDPDKLKERRREKEIIKRRLSALVSASREVRRTLLQLVEEWNGQKDVPRSFDRLEELLAEQAYRLCFWRVAADEINYRRFFDVNELAAIRIEEPQVFAAVHELTFRLLREGHITGLRIDHIDGLRDPAQYLRDLQRGCARALRQSTQPALPSALARYVVVEKILGADERLHEDWATAGTTGYDFLNQLNGVFVMRRHEHAFLQIWQRVTGERERFSEVAYEGKKLILQAAMSGELHVLARRLDRISEQHRYSRDFTLNSLQDALGEVIACFPVYRTYILNGQPVISEEDRRHINLAIRRAQRRNPAHSPTIFEFIRSLLLLEEPAGLNETQRAERHDFVLRFQQLTGPVTAKGVEDTAFYRYYPLASLCEVGGEPARFGLTRSAFHAANQDRLTHWPHAMLTTSTHDTKRSEDVRARLNVLSEIPARWYRAVRRWERLNRDLKTLVEDAPAPDAREEYLIYQTLLGAWPLTGGAAEPFIQRMQEYLRKALREAKLHSSWLSPHEEYEQAVLGFIARILEPDSAFLAEFIDFQTPLAQAGLFNSLAQTLLKITAPGVPDFYQGSELWDFSLVDPDNRRPVDYALRQSLFAALAPLEPLAERLRQPEDGRLKLWLTTRALQFRHQHNDLFERGDYIPLTAPGTRASQVIAFARQYGEQTVLVAAGRFFTQFPGEPTGAAWGDTQLSLPAPAAGCYRDVFTGRNVCADLREQPSSLRLSEAFAQWPLALLEAKR
jgi:(1->4)-alpha-D-glucan 1-alpha-D-glucosylmutase